MDPPSPAGRAPPAGAAPAAPAPPAGPAPPEPSPTAGAAPAAPAPPAGASPPEPSPTAGAAPAAPAPPAGASPPEPSPTAAPAPPAGASPPEPSPTAAPPPAAGGAPPRSLVPREHGAYGQLGAPLAAALALGWAAPAAWGYAGAAVCGFLGHEPALVLLGHRGARAARRDADRARRRLWLLASLGAAAGALGAALGPPTALAAAAVPLAFGAWLATLVHRRREKTFLGETVAAAALAGTSLPVMVAGGLPAAVAGAAWAGWTLGFSATSIAVRTSLVHHKPREARGEPPLVPVLAAQTALLAAAAWLGGAVALAGGGPALAASWAVGLARPHPRQFRRVGWALAAASVAAAAGVVAAATA